MAVLPTGIGPVTGYNIERSLRFNSADSAYLNRTPGSTGNRRTFTFSFWIKRSTLGTNQRIIQSQDDGTTVANTFGIFFPTDSLEIFDYSSAYRLRLLTTQVFRDVSAWYHIVVAIDTTQATASDRAKLYVNGSQVTTFSTATYPSQNTDLFWNVSGQACFIGRFFDGTNALAYLNGYLTEVHFVNSPSLVGSTTNASTTVTLTTGTTANIGIGWNVGGTNIPSGATVSSITNSTQFVISSAATATGSSISIGVAPPVSAFGETDSATGVWKPKKYDGTYGTNGFYLKFADNSNTTAATLGKDSSGNGNNWTPNNFYVGPGTTNAEKAGIDSLVDTPTAYGTDTGVGGEVRGNYCTLNPLLFRYSVGAGTLTNGNLQATGSSTYFFSTFQMPATGKWYFEGVPTAGSSTPGIGLGDLAVASTVFTNQVQYLNDGNKNVNGSQTAYGASYTTNDVIGVAVDCDAGTITFYKNNASQGAITTTVRNQFVYLQTGGSWTWVMNFGQRAFAYTAPSGFKALCTQNLPPVTIGATSTTQANKYMDVTLYTGNQTVRSITNSGSMQPDFVWDKLRSGSNSHRLFDAVRGVEKALYSNLTNAEATETGTLTSFNSNGFSLGTSTETNTTGSTYVAWQWNAGGSNQTISVGQYATSPANVPSIASTVRANTTSGFSIVTGTLGAAGVQSTVGHGLNAVPNMILFKTRSGATYNWTVFHTSIATDTTKFLRLNDTVGTQTYSTVWGAALPTSTVFGVTGDGCGSPSNPFVAYCFAPVAGYSAFGSYTGNGAADGPFVYTGFRPRYIMIKRTDTGTTGNWVVFDTSRDPYNASGQVLYPNLTSVEQTFSPFGDILSTGFKIRNSAATDFNASNNTYIYAAFAESPFKYSLAR